MRATGRRCRGWARGDKPHFAEAAHGRAAERQVADARLAETAVLHLHRDVPSLPDRAVDLGQARARGRLALERVKGLVRLGAELLADGAAQLLVPRLALRAAQVLDVAEVALLASRPGDCSLRKLQLSGHLQLSSCS